MSSSSFIDSRVVFGPDGKSVYDSLNERVKAVGVPASATATGTQGQIAFDASYIYICTATNTWKRVAIATW